MLCIIIMATMIIIIKVFESHGDSVRKAAVGVYNYFVYTGIFFALLFFIIGSMFKKLKKEVYLNTLVISGYNIIMY